MKNLFLSMLAMAAMVSCTNEIVDNGEKVDNGQPAEIRLSAGVLGVETKAAITDGKTFTPAIVGWEVADQGTGPSLGTEAHTWLTETSTAITAGTSIAMPFKTKQYYNPDGTTSTYIKSYYPTGSLTGEDVTFTNTEGDVDVMLTELVNAGPKPTGTATTTALTFSHKLTQLQFKVGGDASLAAGTTLTSITFKATLPTGFNIITDVLAGTEGSFTIKNISGLTIPTVTAEKPNVADIAANAGDMVMIKPIGETTFKIDVVTSAGTFTDVPVTLTETDTNGGKSYTITLTFKQKEISAQGTVKAWSSSTGTGTVE